ncbi:MAG: esterase-like activity of phytase family protein [Ginsengibacter sp.]
MSKNYQVFLLILLPFLISCAVSRHSKNEGAINQLTFLSQYSVPYNQQFEKTTIGGLSGIDYNPVKEEYYFISDDRSQFNPARFYKASISIHHDKIDSVIFLQTIFLKDAKGNFYPNSNKDPGHAPDPEALRFDAKNQTFIWSSEGERIVDPQKAILENPAVTEINKDGQYIDTFQLPYQTVMSAKDFGPRQNGVFEGLTFTNDYRNLFVSVEEPLHQDGPRAGTGDSTGIVRFIKWDIASKKPLAQYAYKIDPVAYPPITPSAFKINGISDILSIGKNKFLVIERSYSTGRLACTIKIFLADVEHAENIAGVSSLKNKPDVKMISKRLLLNMDNLGFYIDNIEGVTFGPTLSNGKRSLLFIADNNFNSLEKSQFLLFEID